MSQDHEDDHETRLPDVGEAMPPIDFNTFILSLASATMIDLGEMEGTDGRRHAPNLAMARHHIDLLAMLQEKTHGNLKRQEERCSTRVLYDLRMRFVARREGESGTVTRRLIAPFALLALSVALAPPGAHRTRSVHPTVVTPAPPPPRGRRACAHARACADAPTVVAADDAGLRCQGRSRCRTAELLRAGGARRADLGGERLGGGRHGGHDVGWNTPRERLRLGRGTGFIITESGEISPNNHVIEGALHPGAARRRPAVRRRGHQARPTEQDDRAAA
ncbi:MAG: DUF1844 domain-containing protein [Polyangiales bacterium]